MSIEATHINLRCPCPKLHPKVLHTPKNILPMGLVPNYVNDAVPSACGHCKCLGYVYCLFSKVQKYKHACDKFQIELALYNAKFASCPHLKQFDSDYPKLRDFGLHASMDWP